MAKTTAKIRTEYVCQQCGARAPRYGGRCSECGAWNSMVETRIAPPAPAAGTRARGAVGVAQPVPLSQVHSSDNLRIPTGIGEFDRVLGGGIVPGSLVLLGGEPGIGKCLTGSTRVLDPVSGAFMPITAWAERLRPVLALDEESHRLNVQAASAFLDQGVQPIVEVRTRLGHILRCTPNHPLLTEKGWQPVSALNKRDRIAAPCALPYFGSAQMADQDVKLIAYILSDGSAQSAASVTSAIPEVAADLEDLAAHYGMTLRIYSKPNSRAQQYRFVIPPGQRSAEREEMAAALQHVQSEANITWMEWARLASVSAAAAMLNMWRAGHSGPSEAELQRLADAVNVPISALAPEARHRAEMTTPVARVLQEAGLRHSTARTKAIPGKIFGLPREKIALFLKTLFSCDGSVYVTQERLPAISYSTISYRLAQDVQHLLLRFGFIFKLRTRPMKVSGQPYVAYELQMLGVSEVKRFLSEIGIWGREEAKAKIAALAVPTLPSTHFDTVPTGLPFWEHLREVSEGASFKALSRKAGATIHPDRSERPLTRSTVAAIAQAYSSAYAQKLANGDVYWDEIESIMPAGEEHVYDLSVSDGANFVANDLIVHNSTLLAQAAALTGTEKRPALYISAEESPQQVKLRADRLGIAGDQVHLLAETDIEAIISAIEVTQPALVVVDSIQTISTEDIASAPGSISQVRECTLSLMRLAKATHIPVMLIGHVTKDGTVAGPRALEHIVDAVIYLEGERFHSYRLLRTVKNRFGPTDVGVFEMRSEGLVEVTDPSGIFLADRSRRATGSAVTVSLEGTRPLLVEIQALASATSFGTPSRTATGVDHNRLLMLLAVLNKRVGLRLGQHDIYVNVVGGLELSEPAVDLGVAVAIASSVREERVGADLAVLGEVGLGGELRTVSRAEARAREAARMGFRRCIMPRANQVNMPEISIVTVTSLAEAIAMALDSTG
jgi:DNA repair protein RadA/Sms